MESDERDRSEVDPATPPAGRPQPQEAAPSPTGETAAERGRADQDPLRALQKERQTRVAKVVAGLAIAVILMLFIIFNSKPARVSFVFFTRHPPLIWVMFACAVLGGILGYLVGRPGRQVSLRRHPKDERRS